VAKNVINSPFERFTRVLFSKVIERLAVVVSKEQLSFSQMAALHIIDREKTINIQDIASKLNLSISATSRLIDDIVKKDLIERKEDQDNRRAKNLSLTISGKKFMDKLSLERIKIFEEAIGNLANKIPKNIFKFLSSDLSFKANKKQEES